MVSQEIGEYLEVAGLKTFYIKTGTGDPLLLMHGGAPGACSLVNYGPVIEPLSKAGFTVYAFDQPGYGYTDNPTDFSAEFRVTHTKAFIDAVGLERFHFIGNSAGVYPGLRLALEDPRMAKLIIIAGGGFGGQLSAEAQALGRKHGEDLGAYTPSIENMRKMLSGTIFNQDRVTEELVQLRYEMSAGRHFEAQQQRRGAPGARSIVEEIPSMKVKTLVMWGRNDRGSAIEQAYRAFEMIPDAELHTFNNCAHWPMWDQTERFITVVADFLHAPD